MIRRLVPGLKERYNFQNAAWTLEGIVEESINRFFAEGVDFDKVADRLNQETNIDYFNYGFKPFKQVEIKSEDRLPAEDFRFQKFAASGQEILHDVQKLSESVYRIPKINSYLARYVYERSGMNYKLMAACSSPIITTTRAISSLRESMYSYSIMALAEREYIEENILNETNPYKRKLNYKNHIENNEALEEKLRTIPVGDQDALTFLENFYLDFSEFRNGVRNKVQHSSLMELVTLSDQGLAFMPEQVPDYVKERIKPTSDGKYVVEEVYEQMAIHNTEKALDLTSGILASGYLPEPNNKVEEMFYEKVDKNYMWIGSIGSYVRRAIGIGAIVLTLGALYHHADLVDTERNETQDQVEHCEPDTTQRIQQDKIILLPQYTD